MCSRLRNGAAWLLSRMGYRLEVAWRPVLPDLTRSEWRSWRLHCRLSTHLTRSTLEQWRPTIERNLERLRSTVRGQPHLRNLDRWEGSELGIHKKIRCRVERVSSDTSTDPALAWLYVVDAWEGGLPSARYLGVMADAAEIAGAPADYVHKLRTRPSRNIGPGHGD